MNLIKYITFGIISIGLAISCTREFNSVKPVPISAVTIVNGVINSNPLLADLSGADSIVAYFYTTQQIRYGSFFEYSIPSGKVPANVFQVSDTDVSFFSGILNLQPQAIYSLYLSSSDTTGKNIDTLFLQDDPPYHSDTDSTAGIRFINLSKGSNPMSVDIQGNVNGSEVSSLAYQAITNFKNYQATLEITQYNFEIRDAASGNLLTTYTYTTAPFQNITIAVIGSEDTTATVPISVMQINNY
jgi:hypothetical protein